MATNNEIATWLREAAEMSDRLQLAYSKFYPGCADDTRLYDVFNTRAALVEQMRCEMCRWWQIGYCGRMNNGGHAHSEVKHCGPQFFCCHWEGRE